MTIFETNQELRLALTQMIDGTVLPDAPSALQDLYHSLLIGDWGNMANPFFVLKDFGSYSMAQRRIDADYADRDKWNRAGSHQYRNVRCLLLRPHDSRVQRHHLAS